MKKIDLWNTKLIDKIKFIDKRNSDLEKESIALIILAKLKKKFIIKKMILLKNVLKIDIEKQINK